MPLVFEENVGQATARVPFIARARGYDAGLTTEGLELLVRSHRGQPVRKVALRFGSERTPRGALEGEGPLPSLGHYLGFGERSLHARHFSQVRAREVQPGVDVVYRSRGPSLEYDLVLAPGVSPSALSVEVLGADEVTLDDEGNVVVDVGGHRLVQRAPVVYQDGPEGRLRVPAHALVDGRRISFAVGPHDPTRELVIDPVLELSSYLGGAERDRLTAVEVDAAGNVYAAGYTETATLGFADPNVTVLPNEAGLRSGGRLLAKFTSGGVLHWYTVLADAAPLTGDDEDPLSMDLAIAESGTAWLVGRAEGHGGPPFGDCRGGFTARLTRTRDRILSLHCPQNGAATRAVALDRDGDAIIGGSEPHDFVIDGIPETLNGSSAGQVWVLELRSGGIARLFGGPGVEVLHDIAVAPNGTVWIAGSTTGQLSTTAGALQPAFGGGETDGFLAQLRPLPAAPRSRPERPRQGRPRRRLRSGHRWRRRAERRGRLPAALRSRAERRRWGRHRGRLRRRR